MSRNKIAARGARGSGPFRGLGGARKDVVVLKLEDCLELRCWGEGTVGGYGRFPIETLKKYKLGAMKCTTQNDLYQQY